VITADDFGLAREVNEAVETAHCDGILSAASLMVGAPAAADAIARARLMPQLRVGLHLVLVEGRPVLPAQQLPDLVDHTGKFRSDLVTLAVDIFAWPAARRQITAEITAQFEAFRLTGLALDHVNAHKHFHLHPIIATQIITVGRRYGLRGLRVPLEPACVLSQVEPAMRRKPLDLIAPCAALLGRHARRAGLRVPDAVFGLAWSGTMTQARVCGLLRHLPEGRTEIYLHPATSDNFAGHAPGYRYADELAALTAPSALAAARSGDFAVGGYGDF
jgi:hopanoid biosynthesis associated protein HpnK